jgi:hypothetical protein
MPTTPVYTTYILDPLDKLSISLAADKWAAMKKK